eukprot:11241-Heterococcus_DN1.PRE.4
MALVALHTHHRLEVPKAHRCQLCLECVRELVSPSEAATCAARLPRSVSCANKRQLHACALQR